MNGQEVLEVHEAALRAVERGRAGHGPSFLLCDTYRYRGHHVGDIAREYYRPKSEEQQWMSERDPIALLITRVMAERAADQSTLDRITAELTSVMDDAVASAIAAPYPTPDEVNEDVYA